MDGQVSTNDILEAINAASTETQKQFDAIQSRIDSIEGQMATKQDIRDMATKQDIREFQLHIIDKMSEGFADLEGVTVSRQRKEDQKVI